MHKYNIAHPNLNTRNIMVTKDFKQIKIVGLVDVFADSEQFDKSKCNFDNDIWRFGCVMMEICTGVNVK